MINWLKDTSIKIWMRGMNRSRWCHSRNPWLTYWITFSTHIFKFEWLLKRPFVICTKRKNFRLDTATRNCDLHCEQPWNWKNLMWSSYAQHTSERWCGVSKPTCKWSILERTQFATFYFISHMSKLLAVLELIDIIINLCNLWAQVFLHFVTDLAGVFCCS